ncbi:ANTAR domain-containing protein [Kribbella sp. VKM Ac-2569]|uniref:GAF and ANTAR domain-containing protein n=1 Tax=Kribbella sp. VKM Ac-2569 TaxID=2512220 RepID=UPI00102B3B27|nr:GAF and ANTAR domain-containing protein [Kribbella sp. VKM Ac-2569]RZT16795.1 ANTAR domain-containing protein [Kribbella sp. VKM Ac-2569]
MDRVDRTTLLARLARKIAEYGPELPLETRLCRAYLAIVGGDGAAITLSYTEPSRVTLCATDDVAARLEDLQDVLGEGPGPTAYVAETAMATDVRVDRDRWPLFTEAAREVPGVRTVYAVPMRPGQRTIGVLTVHQNADDLPDGDRAQFLADAIGAALMKDPPPPVESDLDPGPWSTRAQIHQATGMVLMQLRISPTDAMALMRAHAFSHSTTLAEVAEQITSRRLRFSDDGTDAEHDAESES